MSPRPLDAQLAQVLPFLDFGPVSQLTPERWRGFLRALSSNPANPPPPPVERIENRVLPLPGNHLAVRVYRPSPGPLPTVVFFHGGGWVGGDLETHDVLARVLALELNAVVVSVDYRRPPEAPYPSAWNDALEATRYVSAHLRDFGGEGQALAVAGDSSGANLAAVVAIAARDEVLSLQGQLLLYPTTDATGGYADETQYPSRRECASGYFITLELMRWVAAHAVPLARSGEPWASPLRAASLRGVAPAVLALAHFDPTRDEGRAYAQALRTSGVEVHEHAGEGLTHAYFGFEGVSAAAAAEAKAVRASFAKLLSMRR